MPEFELAIIKVDVNHAMGSNHDDPRHGVQIGNSRTLSTPQELDVWSNECRVTDDADGGISVYQSQSEQSILKKGETLYVNTGFKFASDKAKYYRIIAI